MKLRLRQDPGPLRWESAQEVRAVFKHDPQARRAADLLRDAGEYAAVLAGE